MVNNPQLRPKAPNPTAAIFRGTPTSLRATTGPKGPPTRTSQPPQVQQPLTTAAHRSSVPPEVPIASPYIPPEEMVTSATPVASATKTTPTTSRTTPTPTPTSTTSTKPPGSVRQYVVPAGILIIILLLLWWWGWPIYRELRTGQETAPQPSPKLLLR